MAGKVLSMQAARWRYQDRYLGRLADAADSTVSGAGEAAEIHAALGNVERAADWAALHELALQLRQDEHGGREPAA